MSSHPTDKNVSHRKSYKKILDNKRISAKYFIKQNIHAGRTKKRYHDSRRSTVTTQTQNKTRQNYYAILPVYAGEA